MILLTGATGKTGSVAAARLAEQGLSCRALVRDASRAAFLQEAGIELVVGDIAQEAIVDRALEGVDKALLVLPNSERQLELEVGFIDRAAAAGVSHLVKLSSMEADADVTSPIPRMHYEAECHLKQSGMSWTMVRPNFFMQNLLGSAATIREQHKFFMPLGDGRTGMSDARDIGAVIAAVLATTGHENHSYDLTGPELLSFSEVAERFSAVLGTPVSYVNMPLETYREVLAGFLSTQWHVDAVCDLFAGIAAGGLEYRTDTIREILGREPISFTRFVQDHLSVFKPD